MREPRERESDREDRVQNRALFKKIIVQIIKTKGGIAYRTKLVMKFPGLDWTEAPQL